MRQYFVKVKDTHPMHYASQWRCDIAQRIAPIIARNPAVSAIMVSGSTSRDRADSFSDIEIGVFWSRPPHDEERIAPIESAGGTFWELDPYNPEDEVWMEEWGLNELKIDMRNMTVGDLKRQLQAVLVEYDTTPFLQYTLSAVQHGISLYGHEIIQGWQESLVAYPVGLQGAMVRHYIAGDLREWCWWIDQLLSRGDTPLVYQSFNEAIFSVISILMGLNKIYHPGYKWLKYSLAEMPIQPENLGERIQQAYHLTPHQGFATIQSLVLESYDLATQALPQLAEEITYARTRFLHQRKRFEHAPLPQ